jgi:hypothetical protein
MKTARSLLAGAALLALGHTAPAQEWLDRVGDALTFSNHDGRARARISGLFDLEGYSLDQPPPGLLYTNDHQFLNYRFTFYVDAQVGDQVYFFAQTRIDRGFDPSESQGQVRLDEVALRVTPWKDGRFSLQIGKFGTIAGNWVSRHDSWANPFITAPLPYENLTGIWDGMAVDSMTTLQYWGHVYPSQRGESAAATYADKTLRLPVIWGPSYASGVAIFGALGKFEYAAEMKNSALCSRPEAWDVTEVGFEYPTFTTRLGFRPNPTWNFGVSGSTGSYLVPDANFSVAPGYNRGDYRQLLLGQDISFEWRHFQFWAEFFETRFEIPGVGNADTFSYYLEAKYKFTPQLFGALRWNQQLYSTLPDENGNQAVWGRDLWRIDAALGYRFSTHLQGKLQYTVQHEDFGVRYYDQMVAAQFTLKF